MNTPEHSEGAGLVGNQTDLSAKEQIRQQLNDAKARGRWTVTRLAQRAELSRTTVSNALNGGPISAETLACLAGPLRLDAQQLLELLRQANAVPPGQQGSQPQSRLQGEAEPSDEDRCVLGRPISKLDPWDLEVHRAIDVAGAEHAWPELPEYARREHDARLTQVVERAAEGQSDLLMLVGPSSTGKTRACWEAIQALPDTWHVWHPIDPDRPEAALRDLANVGPRTVVWLNESQHYLLSSHGEAIAAKLRSLLSDTSRAPVLVLGTIWPEYHERLTREPATRDQGDSHSQARHLLAGRDLVVPNQFDRLTISRLRRGSDPRLVAAATHAEDGMITQYLAGAPELLARYRRATPGARAILEAAMDARRLGHPLSLPYSFLAEAAEGYLSDTEWDLLPDNWLERAFAFLTEMVKGARGALTPIRRPRGAGSSVKPGPSYRLADYLEQLGRSTRHDAVPGEFWLAAVRHCESERAEPLAVAAAKHGLMQISFLLSIKADTGPALVHIANELAYAGRLDEALPCYLRAIEKGDTYLIPFVAGRLRSAGRRKEARDLLKRATIPQFMESLTGVADKLVLRGRLNRALTLYQQAADTGNSFALRLAANRLVSLGHLDEALDWYDRCGDPTALHIAAYRLGQQGRWPEALTWYQRAAEAGSKKSLRSAANQLAEAGRLDEALNWFERAAATNKVAALRDGADALAETDRIDEALQWYRRAHQAGDPSALRVAANYLAGRGRLEEAQDWYEEAVATGDESAPLEAAHRLGVRSEIWGAPEQLSKTPKARFWLSLIAARKLSSQDHIEESLDFYEQAAELGHLHALTEAAQMLAKSGRVDEALGWYERAARAGSLMALRSAGHVLAEANRLPEGLDWFERASRSGDTGAAQAAANELASAGEMDEALYWYERAASAGDDESLCTAGLRLARAGRLNEAEEWIERALNKSHVHVLASVSEEFLHRGRIDQALRWFRRSAMAGNWASTRIAVEALRTNGLGVEAERLATYGWDLRGGISDAWVAGPQLGKKYGIHTSHLEELPEHAKLVADDD
ncbi:tetratricopeptide repeat protein [Streptomyces sp. D2-8]|nr:tetratricopeptide repeat protein [Streptomyces sp. D2-8]